MLDISINFHSTRVRSASLYHQYSKVWRCNAFFHCFCLTSPLPYQSTAHSVYLRPLMDCTWQQARPRQEYRPSLSWQPLACRKRKGGEGLLVSCNWCVVHWAISLESDTDVSTLTSVSLLSLCPDEPIIMRSCECCAFWEVAHKRMISQSFQTEVDLHRGTLCWTKWKYSNERCTCGASLWRHKHSHLALCALLFIWDCQLIMHGSLSAALSAIFESHGKRHPWILGHQGSCHQGVVSKSHSHLYWYNASVLSWVERSLFYLCSLIYVLTVFTSILLSALVYTVPLSREM